MEISGRLKQVFDEEMMNTLNSTVKARGQDYMSKVHAITTEVFNKEQVSVVNKKADKQEEIKAVISVRSSDEKFQHKEFGSDNQPAANRLIPWRKLIKDIK